MKTSLYALGAMLLFAMIPVSMGAETSPYVVVPTHIDEVRQPKSPADLVRECNNSASCQALLTAVSAYTGIPFSKFVTVAGQFTAERRGEGTYVHIGLPSGYSYCKAQMKMTSIVPHDGPKGSLFLGHTEARGFYYETWTPVMPMGANKTWVEADLTVVGVRDDLAASSYQDGSCQAPGGERALFYCRGGGCVDTNDNGQSVRTNTPPGAGSRN